ncbi:hypothetical protein HBB16_13280 [Pseudonocardia sp. MCCB 268]|nr:hypothetical protein [Pseudonocardia cytotoxica]
MTDGDWDAVATAIHDPARRPAHDPDGAGLSRSGVDHDGPRAAAQPESRRRRPQTLTAVSGRWAGRGVTSPRYSSGESPATCRRKPARSSRAHVREEVAELRQRIGGSNRPVP